ncbi:hypothetical protein [Streptococcus saliviloxodontae]|uniref:Transposase n=1 Tax=Streptococcus saliviloxodontae TaxID=1349416 RepID=A0ABS2PNI2_9STRE|nr:hypothetical protein [Streptococcus saliviloxodontae]MBM7636994.1 hypothetical protein [Streptococcus saliviloxodontae]
MTLKENLTPKELKQLRDYHAKKYHSFREIMAYCSLLEKLTKL